MPRIPTYSPDQVALNPLPGPRFTGGATGSALYNGDYGESKALTGLGDKMFEIAVKEQEKVDEARVQERYTELSKAGNESLYGANGVTSKLGSSAVGVADKWVGDFDKVSATLSEDLTPRQQQMFAKYAMTLKRGMYDNVLRHEVGQAKAYQDESYKNLVGVAVDTAATSYRDGALINIQTNIALDALRKRPEYAGASADVRSSMEKELRAGFSAAVVQEALRNGDSAYAEEYFKQVKGDMPLALRSKIEDKIKPATDFAAGKALALEVNDAIEAGKMTIAEGERYIYEKAKTKDATVVAQTVMREMQDAKRRQAADLSGSFVEKFETGGKSRKALAAIMADPAFQAMPPSERGRLVEHFNHRLEGLASQYRAESRAARAEARAEKMEKWESIEANVKMMETLENPKFATMSPNEIRNLEPEIGPKKVAQLLHAQKEAKTTAGRFQIDKDLLNEAVPKELLKPSNKDKLNAFRGVVETELQEWKMRNPGKVPTLEEQKQIARSANTAYIEIGRIWNSDIKQYEVKDDKRTVPKDFYDQSRKWAREKGKNISDDEIYAAWLKQKGKK